jgi:pimeloyl-ACP methyl ester carboxylesterase
MKRLIAKLKRRQIYKFGLIYLGAAWLLIQVAVNVEEPLNLPSWLDTLVITLLALGFPLVLILAWLRDPAAVSSGAPPAGGSSETSAAAARTRATPVRGEIRFCTTPSGCRLAFSRLGQGAPPVLRTGNWVSHLEVEWESPVHQPFLRDLSREFELVVYDGRGTGLSDRQVTEFSLDTMVEDMEAVADVNALEEFAIVAYSQSCAVAVAYAVRHPQRVSRMVLYGGFLHNFRTETEIDAMAALFAETWGQANPATRQLFTTVLFPDATKEEFEAFNELQREAVSPDTAARLFRAGHSIDVRDLATQVSVPTLVMHSRFEPGVPLECSRETAALIPGARLVILDSRNHLVLEREPAYRQFIDETIGFIKGGQLRG